jgi:hypothetical protein
MYLPSSKPVRGSASPADAWNLAVEQLVLLPDGRSGRRGTGSRRKSRSSHLDGSLRRERSVSGRRGGYGGYGNRAYGRRRYRRHFGRIADAARIADRAVESSRIPRSRRNAAHAGILGRRSRRRSQKTQDRNGQQCRSAGHPSAREDRNKARVAHRSVILSRLVIIHDTRGRTRKAAPKFPCCVMLSGYGKSSAGHAKKS